MSSSTQFSKLVSAVLSSQRGLFSVLAISGSLLVVLYYFVLKPKLSSSSTGAKSRPRKSLTPLKNRQTSRTSVKSTSSTPKIKPSSTKLANGASPASKKESPSKTGSKQNKSNPVSPVSENKPKSTSENKKIAAKAMVKQVAPSKANKDDGEWITVAAKKKTRVSGAKKATNENEAPITKSPMKTRSSATQLKTPRRA